MASVAEKRIDVVEDQVEDMPQVEAVQQDEQDEVAQQTEARPDELRILEALLFASAEPLDQAALAKRMPDGVNVKKALEQLQADYAMRGVNLVRIANKWTFRTAGDLAWLMTRETTETKKLSRAAIEVLAIVAYHQPVTRAEIEDIRGVVTSKGTLDVLLETGWIKPRGRRKTPGRPLTFGTTESFLAQFGLEALGDLPGLEELKGTGLLDSRLPAGFSVPNPSDDPQLREDEDPLEDGELELALSAPDPEFPEAQAEQQEIGAVEPAFDAQGTAEADTELGQIERTDVTDDADASALGAVEIAEDADDQDGEFGEGEVAEIETNEVEIVEIEAADLDEAHDAPDADRADGDDIAGTDERPDPEQDDEHH